MCALPRGFIKNLKLARPIVGLERRQEILDDIADQGTFLPRGVSYEDIDASFVEFTENDLSIVIDGVKVPVIFLTLQKWSEFNKTWQHSDKYKNVKMPFITVVRQPNPQVGTNQAGLFNIPGRNTYTYMKVPTFEGGRRGLDVYKIPQPTSVDFTYEVRLFCNRMRDLNKFNTKVQHAFQSIQFYIRVNGHPMPIQLKSIGDESNIEDFEKRRFYVQPFEMVLAGYILDEDSFEVIPAINRSMVMIETYDREKPNRKIIFNQECCPITNSVILNFVFQAGNNPSLNVNTFNFISNYNANFELIDNIENISNILIKVNDVIVYNGNGTSPVNFNVIITDNIEITITRVNVNTYSKFTLIDNADG